MNPKISLRTWTIIAGIGCAVVVGLALLLAFLARGPGELAPIINLATPPQSGDPAVASVNGRAISYSYWLEAVLLDQVLSGLAGQPAPTPDETLQRLISEELVLQAIPPEQEPTAEQIEAHIATLEQGWGTEDSAVVTALEQVGLTRTAFERAIERLLKVQASLQALESQGYDSRTWLDEQRANAEIQIFEDVAVLPASIAWSPIPTPPTSPLPASAESPIPTPIPVPPTEAPTPAIALPEVAPDFTLERAGGGTLTLAEQLAQGPVLLVFFQKCGWGPDRTQLGELQGNYGRFQEAGVEIVALSVNPVAAVDAARQTVAATYPMLADPDHRVAEAYGVYNLLGDGLAAPSVFVIGTDGRILWSYVGRSSTDRPGVQVIIEHLP